MQGECENSGGYGFAIIFARVWVLAGALMDLMNGYSAMVGRQGGWNGWTDGFDDSAYFPRLRVCDSLMTKRTTVWFFFFLFAKRLLSPISPL